ncbi:MAG: acyl--CoA ligase [Clostridia bacterium]|nr:acyl--CoA ligase [Clostridia bacterium]
MSITCYEYLKESIKINGDFVSAISFGNKIRMSKLMHDIDAIAAYFNQIGIRHGDSVTVFLPTTIHAFASFYALNKIGVIANIVHPLTSPEGLAESVLTTKSKAVFILDILAADYVDVINDLGIPCIVCSNSDYVSFPLTPAIKVFEKVKAKGLDGFRNSVKYAKVISAGSGMACEEFRNGDYTAVYLHGGGTTGKSKTIMLSSENINRLAEKLEPLDSPHTPGDECSLVVLPMFHAFGLAVAMHYPITHGYTLLPMPQFTAAAANKQMKKYKVSFLLGVPNMYKKMMEDEGFEGAHLKNLRLVFCGGDFLSERLVKEFNNIVAKHGGKGRLFRGYGLTEVASVCTVNNYKDVREDSIGKPLKGMTVEIWDEMKNKLPAGTTGEIVISGETVMQGYFNGENTVPDEGVYVDKNGKRWVLSGDLGYMDADGFVYFTGRKKRMIIISGYNVYPADIENAVLQIPFINEACAVQGYIKNKPCVKLCVTLKKPMNHDAAIDEIQSYCKKNLARFSCPRKIEIMESFPRTKMAKVDFMSLSDKYDPNNK